MAFISGYRTAGRIRARVLESQLAYVAEMQAVVGSHPDQPDRLTRAANAAERYAIELAAAADHLEEFPWTASFMDLGALCTPRMIDTHILGLRETAGRWRAARDLGVDGQVAA